MSRRLALIIGNSLYRDNTLAKLKSPDADVGALKDTLLDRNLGSFDDVNLVFNSASHIVRREIFNFYSRKKREDLLFLYFTGHGVLDEQGRLYLAVKDTDTEALRVTGIPARYITEEMDNSRSKRQVLVLDCCHSGAFERGSKGSTGASVGTASAFKGTGYGRVILTASDATQYAWEGDQIIGEAENSLFTHFILQGIQTGEADTNRDGNITIDEIYDYAYAQILDRTPKQTPGKWSFKEQGELIISRNPKPETALRNLDLDKPEEEGLKADDDKKDRELEDLYSSVLSKIIAGMYPEAKELIHQIQLIDKDYKDTASLLLRVDDYINEEAKRLAKEKVEKQRKQPKEVDAKGQPEEEAEQKITEPVQGKLQSKPASMDRKVRSLKDAEWRFPTIADLKTLPQQTLWISAGVLVIILVVTIFGLSSLLSGGTPVAFEDDTNTPMVEESSTPPVDATSTFAPTDTITPQPLPTDTRTPEPTSTHSLGVGSTTTNPADGAVYSYIPAGEFERGHEYGYQVHSVYLDAYWMYQYEVTNQQFADFLNAMGNQSEGGVSWLDASDEDVRINQSGEDWQADSGYVDHPVVEVSWYGAAAYCAWAGGRLPTEDEWEKAARGGLVGKRYPWGDDGPTCTPGAENGAQFEDCDGQTVPVGSFAPNGYGLYDMAGNVWEWMADGVNIPTDNPSGPEEDTYHWVRGGGWRSDTGWIRVAEPDYYDTVGTNNNLGFRCALSQRP